MKVKGKLNVYIYIYILTNKKGTHFDNVNGKFYSIPI